MRRREFIVLLGSAAAWPLTARAQQPGLPVIGLLCSGSPNAFASSVAAFRQGLSETGYIEHRNVGIEYRWAEGQYDRIPELVVDLVHRQVAVIITTGGVTSALAAKAATTTIPIVFISGGDPIPAGLVASLNQPGGNLTGVNIFTSEMDAKRLGLLREMVPRASRFVVLLNLNNVTAENQSKELKDAARTIGMQLQFLNAGRESDFEAVFATIAQLRADALIVGADAFFFNYHDRLIALAARLAIPAIYEWREYVEAGGLASYGTRLTDAYRQVGVYTGRILKGEKPADLPVMQSTKFEFVMNLKTAKALGLEISPGVLAIADEVIE